MATFDTLNMNVSNTISILGCGWLGLPLGKRLIDEGFSVIGSTTNQARIELLRKANITPVLINLQETKVPDSFLKVSVLIIAIPTSAIHLENLQTLLKHAAGHDLKKVILVSSTGIYKDTNTEIAESDGSALNTESKLFAIEELVKSVDQLNPVILRMAGLMGYDRQPVNYANSLKVKANPNGRTNMIHRDDAIEIIFQVIQSGIQNETFNCCADEHPTKKEFYTRLAEKAGIAIPVFDAVENDSFKIISNQKIKRALGFEFRELYE